LTEILLPEPCLVVLVAAAGAGKTTFAARHFAAHEVLSSDAYRARIAGDEADQRATRAAFGLLHADLERRLADRLLTVVDATNVEPSARLALLARARMAGVPAVAVVLDLPAALVLARNAGRLGRVVAEPVVLRHLARLRRGLDRSPSPLDGEGFERVVVLRDVQAVESLTFRRLPA
jgi:protein phosphatase